MNKPIQLDPADVVNFITRPEPAVLFLSIDTAHRFNHSLCEHFAEDEGIAVAFGELPLLDLFDSANPALAFLHGEIRASGASVPIAVPPGYYLFHRGQMLAWDLGLPFAADAKRIIRGSMLGAALSLLTKNWRFVGMALLSATEEAAAERTASRFRRAAAAHRENPWRTSERTETTTEELASAYHVLGVDPTASDEEVTRAWRSLQQKFHPDRAAHDPGGFDRLTRRCVEINRARQIIKNHRRASRQHAAAD